jgi:diguanylate cyclase (GGDEF)-like protein
MPDIPLPAGQAGQATGVAIMILPLLLGIWVLACGHAINAARLERSASLRLSVAALLRVRAHELVAMAVRSLMKVRNQVAFDDLTGVLRRSAGVVALERELARARRRSLPLVAAFVDADGLKQVNDSQGHSAGDALLRDIGAILRARLRAEDVIFRYGGDEFVCILVESALGDAARVFDEMLATARLSGRSFSYGLALATRNDNPLTLLGRADQDLYDCRQARRAARQAVGWREGSRRPIIVPGVGSRASDHRELQAPR